ncbi:MAG: type VII secretion target [Mycobacterium sp.]|uniref:type VII secretion target n=1 Tax=Mycobacterium sp. TaxID=1785 RepID=UPI003CC5BEDF
MGQTYVEVAALRAVANQLDCTAQIIDAAARNNLSQLAFNGATAGRGHIGRGNALHTSLNRLHVDLAQWSRATVEISAALRAAADRYADAELRSTARIG